MKRNVILIVLALVTLSLTAVEYRPMLIARERYTRRAERLVAEKNALPLVLDTATESILAGADRVETFRLADFHEGEQRTEAEDALLSGDHQAMLDNYVILRAGSPQDKTFAATLRAALSQTPSPIGKDGRGVGVPSCFDPGIGFRIWKGAAHVDLCVCFYCSGIEIVTRDADHKTVSQQTLTLGRSRAAFLTLSRQAFPQDVALAALKDTEGD